MNRDTPLAVMAIASIAALMLAVFVLGEVLVAREWDVEINITIVGGALVAGLGFVGLSAIVWHLIRRLMD